MKVLISLPMCASTLQSDLHAQIGKNEIDLIVSRVECSREEATHIFKNCNYDVLAAFAVLKEQAPPEVASFTKT